jgi:MFS family permease
LIPSLAPLLIADLNLTRAQIGGLIGFTFVIVYSLVGLVLGVVADRWPRRALIAGGLSLWSVMTVVSGSARGYLALALPRFFTGVGQAALTPAALAMLGDAFPRRRLGLASGIYYAGLPIGTGLSLGLAAWIAPRYGWRACFYLVGVVGLAALGLVAMAREPSRRGTIDLQAEPHAGSPPTPSFAMLARDLWRALVERPALMLVMVGGAMLTYGSAAATHGVTWLVEERGFDFATAAYLSGLMAVASGFLGNLVGGWFSDSCARRWTGGRARGLALMALFFAPFNLAFFVQAPGTPLFYVCWFFSAASTVATFGPVYSAVQELSPPHVRASLLALALLVVNLVGVGPGSLITGAIGDRASLTAGLAISVGVALAAIVPFVFAARLIGTRPNPSAA